MAALIRQQFGVPPSPSAASSNCRRRAEPTQLQLAAVLPDGKQEGADTRGACEPGWLGIRGNLFDRVVAEFEEACGAVIERREDRSGLCSEWPCDPGNCAAVPRSLMTVPIESVRGRAMQSAHDQLAPCYCDAPRPIGTDLALLAEFGRVGLYDFPSPDARLTLPLRGARPWPPPAGFRRQPAAGSSQTRLEGS